MNLPAQPERLAYSLGEVAQAFGVSERSIYNYVYQGELRAVRIGGRRLILKTDLDAYLASRPNLVGASRQASGSASAEAA